MRLFRGLRSLRFRLRLFVEPDRVVLTKTWLEYGVKKIQTGEIMCKGKIGTFLNTPVKKDRQFRINFGLVTYLLEFFKGEKLIKTIKIEDGLINGILLAGNMRDLVGPLDKKLEGFEIRIVPEEYLTEGERLDIKYFSHLAG